MPKHRLTEVAVGRLRPPKIGRVEYPDGGVPGLSLRITDKGRKSWSLLYRVAGEGGLGANGLPRKGKLRRMTLGFYPSLPLKAARDAANDALKLTEDGYDPVMQRSLQLAVRREAAANTLDRIVEDFVRLYAKPNTRKWRVTQSIFERYLLPRWGNRPLEDIKRRDAIELLDEIAAEGKPYAAADVLKHTRKLFNWAIERDLTEANPFDRIKPPVKTVVRDRVLKDDEIVVVWWAAEQLVDGV